MDITMPGKVGELNYNNIKSTTLTKNNEEVKLSINKSEEKVSEKDAKKVVEKLNELLKGENTHAEYSIHEGFGDTIIKIVDNQTKQVVNEFPSKKVLDMVKSLCDLAGVMIDKHA